MLSGLKYSSLLVISLTCAVAIITSVSFISPSFPVSFVLNFTQQLTQKSLSNKPQTENECDLFKGHWIEDTNGSLYNSTSCGWIPETKNCFKHGRRDMGFVNWRWKPEECELPRFDPKTFLRIVRGKKMAFIGDSIARNQMDSLLCLLAQEAVPVNVYKNGDSTERAMSFPSYNFTLLFIRSLFLVKVDETIHDGSPPFNKSFNLHLDKPDIRWAKQLPDINYAILSDGHWFLRKHYLYVKDTLIGCTKCNETNLTNLGHEFAFQKAFQTALDYIKNSKNSNVLMMTIVRTYSPAHFENGSWLSGGYCNRTGPLSEEEVGIMMEGFDMELRTIQVKEIERLRKEEGKNKFRVLDTTEAMLARVDGHPDSHWDNRKASGAHDCLHWCLPGPIDAWNDLLLAVIESEA